MKILDEQFNSLIPRAIDGLLCRYIDNLDSIAVTYKDKRPSQQLSKQGFRKIQLLVGLYKSVPLVRRDTGYNLVLRDKITRFKHPILVSAEHSNQVFPEVKHKFWHEITHRYGINQALINEIKVA